MGSITGNNNVAPTITSGMKLRLTDIDNVIAVFHVNRSSRSITARWKNGMLAVNVPAGTTTGNAVDTLLKLKNKILSIKPVLRFHDQQIIEVNGLKVKIATQSLKPNTVTMTGNFDSPTIAVGTNLNFDNDEVSAIISKLMAVAAKTVAPSILIPRAKEIAATLGLAPKGWVISNGHRTLGTCNRSRVISLSSILVFLSDELRDYIICHELATCRK